MAGKLIIGQIALSFHAAAAAVVAELLEEVGHTVSIKEAPHEQMYEWHKAGKVDLVCSAWLPASHEVYLQSYVDQIEKLAVIYKPYCIWGVSSHISEEVVSIEQLSNQEFSTQFRKLIQGVGPGAGISRFSRQILEEYHLDQRGFYFENGTLQDCTNAFIDAVNAGEPAVVPLWHPQWLHNHIKIRELDDSKGLLGGEDEATLLIRKDALPKVSEEGLRLLRRMYLGNTVVSKLDYEICKNAKKPRVAAREWIAENRHICDHWVGES